MDTYNIQQISCLLSAIAYGPNPAALIAQRLPGWQLVFNPADTGGNYAIIVSHGLTTVLAIRGSETNLSADTFENWFGENFDIGNEVNWPYINSANPARVSAGAWHGFFELLSMHDTATGKPAWQVLSDAAAAGCALVVTGHSLGGNLASVYASWLFWQFNNLLITNSNISVYTFAAPAAGNLNFANDFNAKLTRSQRFENTNDIVPKFPVVQAMQNLKALYVPSPAATSILLLPEIISGVCDLIAAAERRNGGNLYTQVNGAGALFTFPVSGRNTQNTIENWFSEVAYQHSISNYCTQLGVTPVTTEVPAARSGA